ncbi:MAG: hypothetical protein LBI72_03810 [Flavobacteriaceae bacterium]|jgi:gamma-glutamyl:cysteine ligase YbdK (ATP-grasp superfamily)|nr:hypothetical protein [Flavobacteriaceae bacterium]
MLNSIDKSCKETDSRSKFVFQENGRKLTLVNKNKVESTKVKVDGCHIKNDTACDFMLVTDTIDCYIELKGQDVSKALGQIIETISKIGKDSNNKRKAYVICSKTPQMDTSIQMKKKSLQSKYRCELDIASNQREYNY